MLLVKLIEPPYTEPYVRWCERSGDLFKFPSYSIAIDLMTKGNAGFIIKAERNKRGRNVCYRSIVIKVITLLRYLFDSDTERYDKVKNDLRAEKVVFLTATPLRGGGNFNFYKELANAILERNDTYEEIDELSVTSSDMIQEQELICAKFDPKYPITRYFKDTMRYLDIHEKKERTHRVIPEIWEPRQGETREMTLARNIEEKIKVNSNSKFVIFVRFKKGGILYKRSLGKEH